MRISLLLGAVAILLLGAPEARSQPAQARAVRAANHPLPSLRLAVANARRTPPPFSGLNRTIPNKVFGPDTRAVVHAGETAGPVQTTLTGAPTTSNSSFDGADNDDNGAVLGYRVAPPDTDGDVGPNDVVQMINLVTTVFDKSGAVTDGPFASDFFWTGMGGHPVPLACANTNRGDPIVLYDEADDRWIFSQFAFETDVIGNPVAPFVQCVAVSTSGDPMGGWNRYAYDLSSVGFNDYPKLGIVSGSITYMANIFLMPYGFFGGSFLGAMDKAAMYGGTTATMKGYLLSALEFGFVAGDLDDPTGNAGPVPALFATAMSRSGYFDIWELTPDFVGSSDNLSRIAAIPIPTYDADFCGASREACIPQPSPGENLETLSDRLMHRLAIRDFGTHRSMVASHTIDVGGGRAGVRWYEMRESGGSWSMHQMGTYAPNDGLNRWMPSIAINAAGDIGLGYLVSSTTQFMSVGVAGQSASQSGSGFLDSDEVLCVAGSGVQTGTGRAGDYSATVVDPVTDRFWHTNEYGRVSGNFEWATRVCEFSVSPGTPPPPPPDPEDVTVADVSTGTYSADRGKKGGTAAVTVVNDLGQPVANALVTGDFSGDFDQADRSAVSGADGVAHVQTTQTKKIKGEAVVGFCVSNVVDQDGGLPYVPDPQYECVIVPPPDPGTEVVIASITTGQQGVGQGQKVGTAAVLVTDEHGTPAQGYTVTGNFSGDLTETGASAVTGSDGIATVQTSESTNGKVTVGFCVTSVSGDLPWYGSTTCSTNAAGRIAAAPAPGVSIDGRLDSVGESVTAPSLENYPNPFNPTTVISFALGEGGVVSLRVYDMLGREVATLTDGPLDAGQHRVAFDASRLPAGVYMVVLDLGRERLTRHMTLLK